VSALAKFTPKTNGETARRSAAGSTVTVTSAADVGATVTSMAAMGYQCRDAMPRP
jgi:hypothetical protein